MMATNEATRKLQEVMFGGSSSDGAGGSASPPMPSGVQQNLEDSQMVKRKGNKKRRERSRKKRQKTVATNEAKRKLLEVSYGGGSSDGAGSSVLSSIPSGVQQTLQDFQMVKRERNRRRRERMKKRKSMDPKFWSKNMDPKVWGNLPSNLALEIYKRLPMQSYYRLREVCKDWNVVARERRCVTDPIHKPYFVLILKSDCQKYFHIYDGDTEDISGDDENYIFDDFYENSEYNCLYHGMLTFHIESGGWRWRCLHAFPVELNQLHIPFSVKGLTFRDVYPRCRRSYQVFDAHTKESYRVPKQPKVSKMSLALGMTVDTSVVPHSFKIIVGSLDTGTQIYDSVTKSWETRSSLLVPCEKPEFKSCLHCGDCLYIWSQEDKILVYSLEKDKWSTLNPPSFEKFDNLHLPPYHAGLGTWDGRIFAVTSNVNARLECSTFWVWELVDQDEQKHWKFVDKMPSDMHRLLIYPHLQVVSSFCDELVMIYSWVRREWRLRRERRAGEYVLYNLASKKWERVKTSDLPVRVHYSSEDEMNLNERDFKSWDEWDDDDE